MINKLNNLKSNIILIIIFEIIGCAITFSADYTGTGISAIITKWVPAFIGLTTIILYFASTLFTKKYNWIITIIACMLLLFFGASVYLDST